MTHRVHLLIVVGFGAATIASAVGLTVFGSTRRYHGLESGTLPPAPLASLCDTVSPRGTHLILFSTDCVWCTRQLDALAEAGPPRRPVRVVALRGGPEDDGPLPSLPPWVGLVSVSRPELERAVGPIVTPTHLLLDPACRVVLNARGLRPAESLRRMDAMEISLR